MRRVRMLMGLLLLVAVGCAQPDESLGGSEAALEAAVDDIDTPVRNAVARVSPGCTGTLIGPDLVLTAAHCIVGSTTGWNVVRDAGWDSMPAAEQNRVDFGPDAHLYYPAVLHRRYHAVNLPPQVGTLELADDIALVRLSEAVPTSVVVPREVLLDRPAMTPTTDMYMVGYGGPGDGAASARNRRWAGANGFRDAVTGAALMTNNFRVDPWIAGPGIGWQGTNVERGDSGGPALLNHPEGPIMGVLSTTGPDYCATFGTGDADHYNIREWLGDELATPAHYGWVWSNHLDPTTPTPVSSTWSHTPDGPATVRTFNVGPGSYPVYEVRFEGAGHAWPVNAHVSAYGTNDNTYCNLTGGGRDGDDLLLNVACFAPVTGAPTASRFSLSWIRQHSFEPETNRVAYVSTRELAQNIDSQWNTAGGVDNQVQIVSPGVYDVTFPGQGAHPSSVQVTARGQWLPTPNRCKADYWSVQATQTVVRVVCHDPNGQPAATDFNVLYTSEGSAHAGDGAFAWLNLPGSASYIPHLFYQRNSSITAVRSGLSSGSVQWATFPGLNPVGAGPQVTAYGGDSNYCKISNWGSTSGGSILRTQCYDNAGQLVPSQQTVSFLQP